MADIVIDYGPSRHRSEDGLSSTMIDFANFRVQRAGVCYEQIAHVLEQEFGVRLSK